MSKSKINIPDLTHRPPRSPRCRLGGYAGLPRMLDKGRATVASTTSPNSLYQHNLASFTMGAEYDGKDAIGFIKLFGLPMKVHATVKRKS